MPILEARIETERASRYLAQFCKHAAAMGSGGHTPRMHLHGMMARREVRVAAEWSDTRGTVTFTPWGRCTLVADADTLTLQIDATDEDGLGQIRDVITRDLERFSRRDPLTVTWTGPPDTAGRALTPSHRPPALHGRLQVILLVVAVVLVVGLHLGLVGAIAADSTWTGVATNVVVVLIALKVALVILARVRIRRQRAAKRADES
jgi:hypothetical protein